MAAKLIELRKILAVVVLAGVVAAAFYFFYKGFENHSSSTHSNVLDAVPQSAALIFETERGLEIPRALAADNVIYNELKSTDLFFRVDALLGSLDSAIAHTVELRDLSLLGKASLSIHKMGAKDHDYLLVFTAGDDRDSKDVARALNSLFRPATPPTTRQYDGVTLYTTLPRFFDQKLHYFIHEGLVGVSFSAVLIEESVRAMLQSASVMDSRDFRAVRVTRSSSARGEIYIQYDNFADVLEPFASREGSTAGFFDRSFAKWSALDFNTKANAVRLNGFALAEDSGVTWLNSFRKSKPVAMELAEYMPSNTAYYAFFGYGNYKEFLERKSAIIRRTNRSYTFDKTRESYDAACNCDMVDLASGWIGSQGAMFIVEPASESYGQNRFAAFLAQDGADAVSKLRELQSKMESAKGTVPEEIDFQDRTIFRLRVGGFYGDILGGEFAGMDDPYVTRIDEVILMAQSLNSMRVLINAIDARRTLARDNSYRDLTKEVARESSFMIYSSLSRSPSIYKHILKDEYASTLEGHTPLLRKFQAFVYQVSHYKGDLYYNQAFLRYHPGYSPETNALWEARIDAPVAYPPTFFTNHYTGDLEILVQDSVGRLYLLDNKGSVLWKRKLPQIIRGDIHQVDVYKNDKFQIFFSTDDHLYLIDRNGRDVQGFPINLKSTATAPVAVADYDRSRDYRFFIPVRGGSILSFDGTGHPVKGWEYKSSQTEIASRIRHIRIGKKDYLFALTDKNKVLLLDRKGSPRHKVEVKAENFMAQKGIHAGRVTIDEGDDIESSGLVYCDSLGTAYRLGFNDRLEKFPLTTHAISDYVVIGGEEDETWQIAELSPSQLGLFDAHGEPIFETGLDGKGYGGLRVFSLQERAVGLARPDADRIYLFDAKGKLRPGFPLFGSTEFAIGDMNGDGYYNLITAGRDGFIYAYAIE